MHPMVSSQGELITNFSCKDHTQGENSTTCDPWTSREFVEEMRNYSTICHHCLSDCDHITYLPKVTSAGFRSIREKSFS